MSNEAEQREQRRTKLEEIAQLGAPTYPARYDRIDPVARLVEQHGQKTGPVLEDERPAARTPRKKSWLRTGRTRRARVLSS